MLTPIEEIKNKLDIVEVLSGYIKLQKAGRNFRANCPFHHEKTPSFMVSPERQIWHCFGCGKGGDIFGFVKEIEGMDFSETLKLLAQRAGVTLKKQDPKLKSEKQRLLEICELATKFFEKQLASGNSGFKIKKYLLERGLSNESITEWRIGFAPDDWHSLSDFLKSKGCLDAEIIKSGVVVEKEQNKAEEQNQKSDSKFKIQNSKFYYYDRFRGRIIFPVSDMSGQIVGFAGRVAPGGDEKNAKYINTPQTLIYDKSRVLYGLDKAKMEIRTKNFCVIVEGNTDVIMSSQAGVKNTVASSGTALTIEHLKIIKRYTDNLILAFDSDLAGDNATKRSIDLAVQEGFSVKIICGPEKNNAQKTDPADVIRDNPQKWLEAVEKAQGIIEFYFENLSARHNSKEVKGKKEIAKALLPLLKKIPDKIEQAHWIQELAKTLSVKESFLSDAIKDFKISSSPYERAEMPSKKNSRAVQSREEIIETELLSLFFCAPGVKQIFADLSEILKPKKIENLFKNVHFKKIADSIIEYWEKLKKDEEFIFNEWVKSLPDNEQLDCNSMLFQFEVKQGAKEILPEQIFTCIYELQTERNKRRRLELHKELKTAEADNDKKEYARLLKKFDDLAKESETIKLLSAKIK